MLERIWQTNAPKQINKSKVQFGCIDTENYWDTTVLTIRLIGSRVPLCLWQISLHHFSGAPHILGNWVKWKQPTCWLSEKLHPAELEQCQMWFSANSTGSRLQRGQQISLRLHHNSAFDSCIGRVSCGSQRLCRRAAMHPLQPNICWAASQNKQCVHTLSPIVSLPHAILFFSPLLDLYFRNFGLPDFGRALLCSPSWGLWMYTEMSQTMATNGCGGLLSCCSRGGRAAAQSLPVSLRAASGTAKEGMCIRNGLGNSLATSCNQTCNSRCIISGL